jgi:hypothetical protein
MSYSMVSSLAEWVWSSTGIERVFDPTVSDESRQIQGLRA